MNQPAQCVDGYEVVLCVTGGIACYKAAALASTLVQAGVGVSVVMTEAAQRFVAPLTFRALTGRHVCTGMWEAAPAPAVPHVDLTGRADLVIVAPATANIIGKIASGIADEMVCALVMTATTACPVLLAPAMNERMWESPILQANLAKLTELDFATVGPEEGWLACGVVGKGRLAEPEEIFAAARDILLRQPAKTSR